MREPATLSRRAAAALPLAALFGPAAAAVPAPAAAVDPVLAQIARHQTLRLAVNKTSGRDDDPVYVTACQDEEAAIQALGDMLPTTLAGAAAQLAYMAEVEADFADDGSPLLRTALTVSRQLEAMSRRASA